MLLFHTIIFLCINKNPAPHSSSRTARRDLFLNSFIRIFNEPVLRSFSIVGQYNEPHRITTLSRKRETMNTGYNHFHIITLFFSVLLCATIAAEYSTVKMTVHPEYQTHSKDFKSHQDFSHNNGWTNVHANKNSSHRNHFSRYNAQDFQKHFSSHGYTESQILNQRCLYMFDEFVKYTQTYSGYKCTIQQLHAELKNLHWLQKIWYSIKGTYCSGLQERIHYLYNQLKNLKHEQPVCNEPVLRDHSLETFQTQTSEYKELQSIYQEYAPSLSAAINKRLDAYHNLSGADNFLHYTSTSYNLNNNVKQLLHKYNYDAVCFTQCSGNKLQHALHQESLDLLNRIDHLSPTSVLYDHQEH